MAVSRIATATGNRATGSSTTLGTSTSCNAATTGSDTYAVVLVAISVSTNSTGTTCAVSYGGVSMTQQSLTLLGSSTNRSAIGVYTLANPSTGAQTIAVTTAGAATKVQVAVGGAVYSGVGSVSSITSAASLSLAVATRLNGYAVTGSVNGAAITSPTQNQLYLDGAAVSGVGDYLLVQDAAGTGGNVSFSSSGTATTPTTLGIALHPVPPLTATLTDDFSTQDTAKWSGYGTGVAATGGQLVLTPATSTQRTLTALDVFNLTGSSVYVKCVQFPNDSSQCWMGMQLQNASDSNDTETFIIYKNGTTGDLQFREQVNGVQDNTTLSWTSGNATAAAWWRLSESGGNILWDTSSDGLSWTNQRTKAKNAGVDITAVTITLFAYSDAVAPGTYIFDYFNTSPVVAAASLVPPRQRPNYGSLLQL